jgi:hypothetical protein
VITFKRITGFLALAACLVAAGCGSDDEGAGIPPDSASQLERQLDSIQNRFDVGGGACTDITEGDDPNTTAVQQTIDGLPGDVDQDIRDALGDGFARLFQLVQEQCEEPEQTETAVPEPAPVPTEPTETTPPPEPTETTPPPTETAEPPPTETAPAPLPGEGGDADGAEGGSGGTGQGGDGEGGQGGDGAGVQGGSGGGALVPEGQG